MAAPEFVFEPLRERHDRASFSCGDAALDDYFQKRAGQDSRRRIARVLVTVDPTSGSIAGYYTLSAASFLREDLPDSLAKRLPRYPVPAALLGRLAVARQYQGVGLGALMLADAVKRVLRAGDVLAIYALVVDAKTEAARAFYERFGFQPFPDTPLRLFLPLEPVARSRRQHT